MNVLRLSLALSALTVGLVVAGIANAGVTITAGPGGGNPAENITFNQNGLFLGPGATINGATNQTSVVLDVSSTASGLLVASGGIGQATVQSPGGVFGDVTFMANGAPPSGFNALTSFTDLKFNIDATAIGPVTISAFNGATLLNSVGLTLDPNGQNFFRVIADGLDVITKVVVTAGGDIINDIKQIRVGGLAGPSPLPDPIVEPDLHPEPASILAWGLVAAAGAVATRLRRRSAKTS